jgi:3-hydroxyisobutyrate dehydrogenase-like beta-hydroxyacid dehydrogenase
MKVGFIGLGKMGTAMADRILGAGHQLAVFNRTESKAADLVSRGATLAKTVADAARFGDVVVTMVENDKALAHVVHGDGGIARSLPKGGIHLAMGTHSVPLIAELVQVHETHGQTLVSAPVLGRPPAAAAGQLGILAGGPAAAVEKCRPLFEAMGRRTFECGEKQVGAAAAKIANNLVLACAIEGMAEGFILAEKCGVPGAAFSDILTDGLFASPAYKIYGKIIAEKTYLSNPGFAATTGLKDVNLALNAGEMAGVPLPSAGVCRDRLVSAIARGHGDADWSVMADEQARASGMIK